MNALGLEGTFSVIILTVLLLAFYFIKVPFDMGQPNGAMEDAIDGFIQLGNNPVLLISYIGKIKPIWLYFSKENHLFLNDWLENSFFLTHLTKMLSCQVGKTIFFL